MEYKGIHVFTHHEYLQSMLRGDLWFVANPSERILPVEGAVYAWVQSGTDRLVLMRLAKTGSGKVTWWRRLLFRLLFKVRS